MRTAFIALVSFGVGVGVTLLFTSDDSAGKTRTGTRNVLEGTSMAHALETKLQQSEVRAEALQKRVDELTREAASAQSREAVEARKKEARDSAPKKPRFVYRESADALNSVDWREPGIAVAALMPLLSEAVDLVDGKTEMRPEFWGDLTKNIGPIVTHAIQLEGKGVAWSHPAQLVNLVHVTLRHAGHPMSEAQEKELEAIGSRFVEDNNRRLAGYTDATPQLRVLIEEVEIQDRLFVEIRALLNGPQTTVLYPPGVEGTVGLDFFAGSITWDKKIETIEHKARADLRTAYQKKFMEELKLRAELTSMVAPLIAQGEAALPDAYIFAKPTAMQLAEEDRQPAARVMTAARLQLALYEQLLAAAPLEDAERNRILKEQDVFVPLLQSK